MRETPKELAACVVLEEIRRLVWKRNRSHLNSQITWLTEGPINNTELQKTVAQVLKYLERPFNQAQDYLLKRGWDTGFSPFEVEEEDE